MQKYKEAGYYVLRFVDNHFMSIFDQISNCCQPHIFIISQYDNKIIEENFYIRDDSLM